MDSVHWPEGHEPDGAAIHVVNSGRSVAPPELVWAWLVRPDLWHTYYSNARNVRHIAGPWPQIGPGSRFSWVTFRVPVTTEVTEFQPYQRLAWTGTGRHGARGHRAWILMPDAAGTVITDVKPDLSDPAQALPLGLVDEIRVHVIPVLLGGGTPLFGTLDSATILERTQVLVTPAATHLGFRVVRQ